MTDATKDPTDPGQAGSFTVVVGVSRTSRSPGALRWAVQEAAAHSGRVVAVRAWRPPNPQSTASTGKPPVVSQDRGSMERQETQQLALDLESVLGAEHQVQPRLIRGKRLAVLLAAGAAADLLVVDAPRRGELPGSRRLAVRLVQQAQCPIVVMPPVLGETGNSPLQSAGKAVAEAGRSVGRSVTTAAGTAGRPGIRTPLPRPDPT